MVLRKWFRFLFVLLALTFFAHNAFAIPVGGVLEAEHSSTLSIVDGSAIIDSSVYSYGSTEYVYTYQISNSSSVGLNIFSVGIIPGADAYELSYDAGPGLVDPTYWTTSGSPVQSVDAVFTDTIDNDGLSSAVLWYKSNHTPVLGNGILFGTLSGTPYSTAGEVLVPTATPEPTTVMLLGVGMAFITTIRKRHGCYTSSR